MWPPRRVALPLLGDTSGAQVFPGRTGRCAHRPVSSSRVEGENYLTTVYPQAKVTLSSTTAAGDDADVVVALERRRHHHATQMILTAPYSSFPCRRIDRVTGSRRVFLDY